MSCSLAFSKELQYGFFEFIRRCYSLTCCSNIFAFECLICSPKADDISTKIALLQPNGAGKKMINNSNSGGKDYQAKQEGEDDKNKLPKTSSSTSRQWGGFKNPRIVRVSRSFGGKDRHSKVCTIKGLRDRRIRLSVPTAIQLYDLQERLGLSQPSKVIDWLLDCTKDDIDKLPPLQMPPGDFSQFHLHPSLVPQDLNSPQLSFSPFFSTPNAAFVKDVGNRTLLYTKQGIKLDDENGDNQRMKGKEAVVENKWINGQEHGAGNGNGGLNFFPITQSSYPGLTPYNSYYNWEPSSNLSLSQFGNQGLVSSQTDTSQTLALPSASQFFLCPSVTTAPSFFPPYILPAFGESNDPIRQVNNFQLLGSSLANPLVPPPLNLIDAQEEISFGLHVNSKFHSQSNDHSRLPNKGKE